MKVAVLLRGEPRYVEQSSKLFKHMVIDRFRNIDFKIFAHAYDSQATAYRCDSENSLYLHPVYTTITKTTYNCIIDLQHFNPSSIKISKSKDLLDTAETIIHENYNDPILYTVFNTYKHHLPNSGMQHTFFCPETYNTNINDNIVKDASLRLFYILGQYAGFINVNNMLYTHVTDNKTWIPDLIWNTRYDQIIDIADGFFEHTLHKLQTYNIGLKKNGQNLNNLFVDDVGIIAGTHWMTDFNMFYTFDSIKGVISPYEKLKNIFATQKLKLFNSIDSEYIHHELWTYILDSYFISSLDTRFKFNNTLLKYSNDFSIIGEILSSNDLDTISRAFDRFCNSSIGFPLTKGTMSTDALIESTYDLIKHRH